MSDTSHSQVARAIAPLAYGLALRVLHWLTALCMFVIIPIAWYMTTLGRHVPRHGDWLTLHKSIGLTILLLTAIRVLTRLTGAVPPLPRELGRTERALAHAGHVLLYLILFAMPISGYLNSYGGGHPVTWFWLFRVPALVSADKALAHLALQAHDLLAYLCYALIVGHVLAVVRHQWWQHVDILGRMTGRAARR